MACGEVVGLVVFVLQCVEVGFRSGAGIMAALVLSLCQSPGLLGYRLPPG